MFFKSFFRALKNYFRSFKVISKYGLFGYVFIPGLLTMILIVVFSSLGIMFIDDLSAYILGKLPDWNWIHSSTMSVVMNILMWLLAAAVFFITFKQTVLIILSPVLSHLSEVVEKKITGQEPPKITVKEFISDIGRGLLLNIVNLGLELILVFLFWLTSFIPLVGVVISPILIFLTQSFFAGFGLADYSLERYRMSLGKSNKYAYSNMGEMMGAGAGFLLTMMIPFVGWFFAPTLGTIGATLSVMETQSGKPVELKK